MAGILFIHEQGGAPSDKYRQARGHGADYWWGGTRAQVFSPFPPPRSAWIVEHTSQKALLSGIFGSKD